MRAHLALLVACVCSCSDGDDVTQSVPDAERTQTTLVCGQAIDGMPEVVPRYTIVGDVVAFPSGTQQAPPETPHPQHGQLFAKAGLVVRADSAFELIVPAGSTTRIGWRQDNEPVQRIIVPTCESEMDNMNHADIEPGDVWVVFAGGFYVDESTCVELIVRRPDREDAVARISIGVACEVD